MSTVDALLTSIKRLGDSPGRPCGHLLEALAVTRHTFDRNYADLKLYLEEQEAGPELPRRVGRRSPDTCEDLLNETVRLIHNYVTGAKTLVTHTRNSWRILFEESGEFPEFQRRIDEEFKDDPLTQFVQRLRAYCLHCRPVDPGISIKRYLRDGRTVRTVSLRVKDLADWADWNAAAKAFLDGVGSEIPLLDTCRRYRDKVSSFTDWFEEQTRALRQRDLEDYEYAQRAFHEAELEDLMTRGELEVGAVLAVQEEMLFAGVLLCDELRQLAEGPSEPEERANVAIGLLGRHVDTPELFRKRLFEWYRRASEASS